MRAGTLTGFSPNSPKAAHFLQHSRESCFRDEMVIKAAMNIVKSNIFLRSNVAV